MLLNPLSRYRTVTIEDVKVLKNACKCFPDYVEIVTLANFIFATKKYLPWMGMMSLSKNNY